MKIKRTLITILFCVSLSLFLAAFTPSVEESLTPLPHIGEVVSGFKAVSSDSIPQLNAATMLFKHEESGAQLLFIQNDDNNLAFGSTFQTWAYTNKGMAHVLEHSLLSGSQRYPGNSLFFDLMNRAYLTFANAYTYQDFTCYPITTTSQKEYLNTVDVYLDMLLHPELLLDERVFMREGIRYELADAEAELNPVGVVYNEMQQSGSQLSSESFQHAKALLYPETPDRFNSGGVPNDILDLTYDELLEFYHKYYSPSRMKFVVYGNLDYKALFELLDSRFLTDVEKMEPLTEPAEQAAFDEVKIESYAHPVSQGSEIENQAFTFYMMGAPRSLADEEQIGLRLLFNYVFNNDSFPLNKTLMETGIAADYASFYEAGLLQPTYGFIATFADKDRAQEFYDTTRKVLAEEVEKGLDKELLRAVVDQQLISAKLAGESSEKGLNTVLNAASDWQTMNDPMFSAKMPAYLDDIAAKIDEGFFDELVQKYILDNTLAAVSTTYPEAGLQEKKAAEMQESLKEKKAAMSDAEIESLKASTADYNTWLAESGTPQTTLDRLSVLTVADLPENVDHFEITDETVDGVRVVSTVSELPDVSYSGMLFDISALDMEALQYLDLYSELVGQLPTEKYSVEELALEKTRLLYTDSESVDAISQAYRSSEWQPKFSVYWIYLDEKSEEVMDLMHEIIYGTRLDEESLPYLSNVISQKLGFAKTQLTDFIPFSRQHGKAQVNSMSQFNDYFNYVNLRDFLVGVKNDLETDPAKVLDKLNAVRQAALNKNGLLLLYAGEAGSKEQYDKVIQPMLASASTEPLAAVENVFPAAPANEAIITDSSVNYNTVQAKNDGQIPFSNALYVISTVVNDKLMYPKVREEGGAYGGVLSFSVDHFQMFSYQDPNVANTYGVFYSVPEFMQGLEIGQDELNQYIIKTYAGFEDTTGSLSRAISALDNYMIGKTTDDTLNEFAELKGVKPQDFATVGAELEKIMPDASILTIGGQTAIDKDKDLFETVNDIR